MNKLVVSIAAVTAGVVLGELVSRGITKLIYKDTEDILEVLNLDAEEDKSNAIGLFCNKDISEFTNFGYTYRVRTYKGECGSDETTVLAVYDRKRKLFSKSYSRDEWESEVKNKVKELLNN